jgi:hypothetical protein
VQDYFEEIQARRLGQGGEITALVAGPSDRTSVRIGVGNRARGVQVFLYGRNGTLTNIFSVMLEGTVPVSLAFLNNASLDLYVFGCWNGSL